VKKKRSEPSAKKKMDHDEVRVAAAMQASGIPVHVETERLCTLTATVIVEHLHYDPTARRFRRDYADAHDDAPHVPRGAVLSRVAVEPPLANAHVALKARRGDVSVVGDARSCGDMSCGIRVADDSDLVLVYDGPVPDATTTARLVYTLRR
jgi:hypothetical protein